MHTTPLSSTKKPNGIWMHILVYCLIIGSDCILFCYNKNRELVQLGQDLMVLASILFICLALLKSKGKVKPNYIFLFITIVAVLFTAAFHGKFSGGYISLIAPLSMGRAFCASEILLPLFRIGGCAQSAIRRREATIRPRGRAVPRV